VTGTATLTRLDQSGFLLESRDVDGRLVEVVALDLYLSDHLEQKYRGTDKPHDRLHPPVVEPRDLAHVRWVFASHRHSDHLDPGSIAAVLDAATEATLVLPAPLVGYAVEELGLAPDRLVGASSGGRIGPLHLLPAAHPECSDEFLSTVVDLGGFRIFHSGDSLSFPELTRSLTRHCPDVVLLPANGRKAQHLGTPPNMSLEEAVDLARTCQARLLVPHHYDLFAFNSRPEAEVRAILGESRMPHRVLAPGESLDLHDVLS
jgi:L-ascorbate 6-phosphate lactonase